MSIANPTTGVTVTHTLTLSGFEEALRQQGKQYKEWSGNVSIKIGGRGEATSTYTANTLVDEYGNQSMSETDETGTWIDVIYQDAEINQNTDGKMFTDFIKPEFTYIYSEQDINQENKTLTVDFSVTDKYFASSNVLTNKDNISIMMLDDGDMTVNDNVTKELTKLEDVYDEDGITKIGEKYRLVISNLQQDPNTGFEYSGPMSITFPAGIASDNSNNQNIEKTITIGINEPDGGGNQEIVDVVDPIWTVDNLQINPNGAETTVTMNLIGKDKYIANSTLEENLDEIINSFKYAD